MTGIFFYSFLTGISFPAFFYKCFNIFSVLSDYKNKYCFYPSIHVRFTRSGKKNSFFYKGKKSWPCITCEKQTKTLYHLKFTVMKTKNAILSALILTVIILFSACTEDFFSDREKKDETILPSRFGVDIPDALSQSNAKMKKSASAVDTLQGNGIYEHLNIFIHVGESAAEIVEGIIWAIRVYDINRPMTLSYESDDDNRLKNLVVEENQEYDGKTWEFQLTITDADSEGNEDGGKGIQVFWDRDPIVGIALLKPYNIDRDDLEEGLENAIFRIDYSEAGDLGYDAHMTVSIIGLEVPDPLVEPYAMDNMKMFAGKKGNRIDVYGNSNHPNAKFFNDATGFNWAFVASANEATDLGVAEIGLPPSTLEATDRETLLDYYSIENVFFRQIYDVWPNADSSVVAAYLTNTDAPGYFDTEGFVQGGTAPGTGYSELEEALESLAPYSPKSVSGLSIEFKN